MAPEQKEYGYIAYIDEAGDPGLKRVRPLDENGASEWLVLSAVVTKAAREPHILGWVQDIISNLGIRQRNDLHYRTLSPTRKISAGNKIAPSLFGYSPYAPTRKTCAAIEILAPRKFLHNNGFITGVFAFY